MVQFSSLFLFGLLAAAKNVAKVNDLLLDDDTLEQQQQHKQPQADEDPLITDIIYMETSMGAFEIGLFGEVVPQTANNFAKLAPIYEETGTIFHRVVDNFVIQGGDIDGFGGHSIYGEQGMDLKYGQGFSGLMDENFELKHDKIGRVSVANAGPNTGGSQFFICLDKLPFLDGKHVVFGQVTKGMDVINQIAKVAVDKNDKPLEDVVILRSYSKSVRDAPLSTLPGAEDKEEESPNPDLGKEKDPVAEPKPIYHNDGGGHAIVLLPLFVFAVAAISLALKNKAKLMYVIRGPRYRRVVSVAGEQA